MGNKLLLNFSLILTVFFVKPNRKASIILNFLKKFQFFPFKMIVYFF